ncbi:MAG: Uma2 family endonuclease [Firmicutes bacterium]|nr:Uma2 family endonuclease [Bacillota bacterium]
MAVRVARHRFTVEEYHKMAQAGVLAEDDRVELIEGEVIEMTPIGSRHAGAVRRLMDAFIPLQLERKAIISVQDPIRLGTDSEPQPDLALLTPRPDFYSSGHPGPAEVLLLVEVAETSAGYDREIKLPLYARFGIPEVWLVDLEEEAIEIHRRPSAQGYQEVKVQGRGQTISPGAFPELAINMEEILSASSD